MPVLDFAQARELLLRVVNQCYRSAIALFPVPLRLECSSRHKIGGDIFSERDLNFLVSSISSGRFPIAIQGRSGSDSARTVTATEILAAYAGPLPRLRRDFSRAFIEFPIKGTVRLYDPKETRYSR